MGCPSYLSFLSYRVYKKFPRFYHLTPSDPKWPLTSTINNRDHLLYLGNAHGKYDIPHIYPSWDIMFTRNSQDFTIWPLVTPNDLWPALKTLGTIYLIWAIYIASMSSLTSILLEVLCLQEIPKVFSIWPLVTLNDLWPPPKTIGIIYLLWVVHMVSMTSLTFILLEISCLQEIPKILLFDP